MQAWSDVLADGEFVCGDGQSEHVAAPVVGLYFPATHAANSPPFAPVYPALAVQAATVVLATGEFEFDGQGVLWLAPVVDMYVPVVLFVHVVSAVAASVTENLPAAQSVHP